ncbi:PilW family protein [Halomonas sp. HMF6819]|uniref:PilW family protein n=1 Tax=unclassified Halomonas TaxID=2609666 RepID=UPI002076ADA9|nr:MULTISPECIES: PilW family protein [unclassified Halomonas]
MSLPALFILERRFSERDVGRQTGFTLIELMVAMVIGVLVVLGATQLFVASQQSYRITTALANMQDTGRFALETISRELRQADFKGGCAAGQVTISVRSQANTASPTPAPALQGFASFQNLAASNALQQPLPGSQSFSFRAAGMPIKGRIATVSGPQFEFQTSPPSDVAYPTSSRLLLLQSAQKCELFLNAAGLPGQLKKITSGWPTGSPQAAPLNYSQDQAVTLTALDSGIYYLGSDPTNANIPSLMRLDTSTATPRSEVLASNVVALRARFLVGDTYLPVEGLSVDQWPEVLAVRISLIVQSERAGLRQEPTRIATGNFRFDPFEANDGHLYQVFTTTIDLRNRL